MTSPTRTGAAVAPEPTQGLGPALLAAAMALPLIGAVHAETAPERGLVAMKYLNYQDSQPGDPRIHVNASSFMLVAPLSGDWSVGATVTQDAISGASPAYHTSALRKMNDNRHALDTSVTRYLPNGSLTLGTSVSIETDYVSQGFSLQATRSSETKNTTWTAGLAFNRDRINPSNGIVVDERKQVANLLLGVTQVLGVNDIAQVNIGYTRGQGYFSDPYKVLDKRPREHNSATLLTRWNHYIDAANATSRLSYRYYTDSWGITAHTLGAEYVQSLANGWSLTPMLRLYSQSAASFYVNADASTFPFPPNPPAGAVSYSEDQRVSAFGARTFGVKLARQLDADWLLDIKFEQYTQRAGWRFGGGGSPGLATFQARSIQLGVSRQF